MVPYLFFVIIFNIVNWSVTLQNWTIEIDFTENKCRYAAERLIACGACHIVIIKFDKKVLCHKFLLGLKFRIYVFPRISLLMFNENLKKRL